MPDHLPNLDLALFDLPPTATVASAHKPRILLLYGSTRERSYSRLLVEEAARLLEHFGAETRTFDPSGLPLPDDAPVEHPKVQELRGWCSGQKARSGARQSAMGRCLRCSRRRSTGYPWRWAPFDLPRARPWR